VARHSRRVCIGNLRGDANEVKRRMARPDLGSATPSRAQPPERYRLDTGNNATADAGRVQASLRDDLRQEGGNNQASAFVRT